MVTLVTEKESIATVAQRWRDQYPKGHSYGADKDQIWNKLKKLPKTATMEDVEEIIGVKGWVGDQCMVCEKFSADVVHVESERDWDNDFIIWCPKCARKQAKELLKLV